MKTKIFLAAIVLLGASLRIFYASNLPLSGDESISLLQSSGHGQERKHLTPIIQNIAPIDEVKAFLTYDRQLPVSSILKSIARTDIHPPFYFLTLRFLIRYSGSNALTTRLLSVAYSTLCIVVMYFLGKAICDTKTGLISACLLAVSTYGVAYGPMVRHYPLALLLSLVSTLQIYNLGKKTSLKFCRPDTILYVITTTAGLYTTYIFLFILIFQFIFLTLCNLKNKKNLLVILSMGIFAFLLYLPWLPSFFTQLKSASSDKFYFHGKTSLLSLADYVASFNFTRQLPGRYAWYKFIIIAGVCTIMFLGLGHLFKKRIWRNLALALAAYLLVYFTAELLMGTKTLKSPKQLSFIIGISLLLAALGISGIINRFKIAGVLLCIGFGCVMLCNSVCICRNKIIYDGPAYLLTFPKKINTSLENSPKTLIICNTFRRRYLLSLIHAIEQSVDIVVIPVKRIESHRAILMNLNNYDIVAIAELFKPQSQEQHPKEKYTTTLLNYCKSKGFVLAETLSTKNKPQSSQLMICCRKSRSAPAIPQKAHD